MNNNEKSYYIYVILTESNTLYCGYTDDVEKRYEKHKKGLGAKYTKVHKPKELVYVKKFNSKSDALKAEYKFKHLSKDDKIKVIDGYLILEEL